MAHCISGNARAFQKDHWLDQKRLPAATAQKQTATREKSAEGLIPYSDRGRQYASCGYQSLLKRYGITPSLSRSSNCKVHSYRASFFSNAKKELLPSERYWTRKEARESIIKHMKVFYDRIRREATPGIRVRSSNQRTEIKRNGVSTFFRKDQLVILAVIRYYLPINHCCHDELFQEMPNDYRRSNLQGSPKKVF
jgi:transposase InsO family protein